MSRLIPFTPAIEQTACDKALKVDELSIAFGGISRVIFGDAGVAVRAAHAELYSRTYGCRMHQIKRREVLEA